MKLSSDSSMITEGKREYNTAKRKPKIDNKMNKKLWIIIIVLLSFQYIYIPFINEANAYFGKPGLFGGLGLYPVTPFRGLGPFGGLYGPYVAVCSAHPAHSVFTPVILED